MKIESIKIGDMDGYVQCAAADRFGEQTFGPSVFQRFTVRAGDRWQTGGDTSDDRKFSERTEFRSLTEDPVNTGKIHVYQFDLLIPADYPEISPKQTLGQWHEGGYPVAFVRYENGKLEFVTNYRSGLNFRREIPFRKGKVLSLDIEFDWTTGDNAGSVDVYADWKRVVSLRKHSLVEASSKTLYFKYGIYRSGMDDFAGPRSPPDQTVYYVRGTVRRYVKPAFMVDAPAPVPVVQPPLTPSPAPVTPAPAEAAFGIYDRIGRAILEIHAIQAEVAKSHAASADFAFQAVDKLTKMAAQMRKADAKAVAK